VLEETLASELREKKLKMVRISVTKSWIRGLGRLLMGGGGEVAGVIL
jgi:hypothetical protein